MLLFKLLNVDLLLIVCRLSGRPSHTWGTSPAFRNRIIELISEFRACALEFRAAPVQTQAAHRLLLTVEICAARLVGWVWTGQQLTSGFHIRSLINIKQFFLGATWHCLNIKSNTGGQKWNPTIVSFLESFSTRQEWKNKAKREMTKR